MLDAFKKVEAFLKNKLYSFLRLFKFFFLPRNRVLGILMVVNVVVCVFVIGHFARAFGLDDISLDSVTKFVNRLLFLVAYALGWLVTQMFTLVVVISSYNGFVNNPAVDKGWIMVRDICNMLFVVVLLVIAFGEILRLKNYQLKTMLPKVVIAAVAVNFSKLVCALIIDGAQVAMMTFVNGYQATAGANIVVGLGLTKLLALPTDASASKSGVTPAGMTLSIVLAILMLIATLLVVFFIALILLVRIVTLWILIVLSPVAFLSGAVPIAAISSQSGKWWNKFGWHVAIGPIMAFFLWLSLAVMSNPDEMYPSREANNLINDKTSSSAPSDAGLAGNLAQFAIGLSLLLASLVAAQECGGVAGDLAKGGMSRVKQMASPVTNRLNGLYGPTPGTAKDKTGAKKPATNTMWGRLKGKTFRTKEGMKMGVKQGLGAPVKGAAGLMGGAMGAVGGFVTGKGVKAGWQSGSNSGKRMAERIVGNGDIERQARQASFGGGQKVAMEEATAKMRGRNLHDGTPASQAELQRILLDESADIADRKVSADLLAKQGKIDTQALRVAGQNVYKDSEDAGDFDSGKNFMESVKKTHAEVAYDLGTTGLVPGSKEAEAFKKDYVTGKIDPKSLENGALESPALQAQLKRSNAQKHARDMSAIAHGDDLDKAKAVRTGLSAVGNKAFVDAVTHGRSLVTDADSKSARIDMLKTGVSIKETYGERDATGALSGALVDPALEASLEADMKELNAEEAKAQITNASAGSVESRAIAKGITVGQLSTLASSGEPSRLAATEKAISEVKAVRDDAEATFTAAAAGSPAATAAKNEMDKQNKKLLEIASDSRIMGQISSTAKAPLVAIAKDQVTKKIADVAGKHATAMTDLTTANTAIAGAETTIADATASAADKAAAQVIKATKESDRKRFEDQVNRYEERIEKLEAERDQIK